MFVANGVDLDLDLDMSRMDTVAETNNNPAVTGLGGRIGRKQTTHAEGRKFEARPNQSNDFQKIMLVTTHLPLGITRAG